MNFRFVQEASYSENILKFEELLEEFERASQEKVSESLKIGALVDGVPQHVRQHVLLNMNENTKYEDSRPTCLGMKEPKDGFSLLLLIRRDRKRSWWSSCHAHR